jgi:hypothetical protein
MSKPETFLDVFEPPEGMVGHSAVLVAMTAAEDFLEAAMQRFSGLRPRQRAELGIITTYLLLDGHATAARRTVLPPGRVPGLNELQPKPVGPGSLLHAKLALLAFAASRTSEPLHVRLAVLTANFTYTSARQQLELIWTVDVPLDTSAPKQDRADVSAAGEFVQTLLERRFYREESSVPAKRRRLTARLDALLEAAASVEPANPRPRFIHSLDDPLYDQIRRHLRKGISSKRNFLLCGSGFYEQPLKRTKKPTVLAKLEDLGVCTGNVCRVALVEPEEAGALGTWAAKGMTDGWTVARPVDVLNANRRLHAKFVYVGYLRDGYVSNGWLYLGSGNLTQRGLLTSGAMRKGNIECGVVCDVADRLDGETLERCLFWRGSADDIEHEEWRIGAVGDAPETVELLAASPVLCASVVPGSPRELRFAWREDVRDDVAVSIAFAGRAWEFLPANQPAVPLEVAEEPNVVRVREDAIQQEWTIPVIDAAGRIAWQPPRFDTYADALAALLDFPIRPAEAAGEDDDEPDGGDGDGNGGKGKRREEDAKAYALHSAAELIEHVATLQRSLPASMLDDWLDHLDRMLRSAFPETLIATWREYRIDLFAHLREPELRPPDLTDKQRSRYVHILDRTATAWSLR